MKNLILLNDDVTPMSYVSDMLQEVLGLTESEANRVMQSAHQKGEGSCGTYADEDAEKLVAEIRKHIDNRREDR